MIAATVKRISQVLALAGLSSLGLLPLMVQAQPSSPEAQCYSQSLTFGASERDRDRAQYLCDGASSTAPAQCYWQALGFGASVKAQDRAARLCRGAGNSHSAFGSSRSSYGKTYSNSNPAQCYWDSLGFGASRRSQYQALEDCSAQPILEIPLAVQECTVTTQRQFRVSRSSALLACSNAFDQR